jgi:hypothetical protein
VSLTCAANDGRLLSILPVDVAVAYPVLPRYAPPIPPAKDLSDDVELLMKTYAPEGSLAANSQETWR